MKETAGLEFKFGIKYREDKKQKISIYELGKFSLLTLLQVAVGLSRTC